MFTLITGASSGIGKVFADAYAARKKNLILTARSSDKLSEIASALATKYSVVVKVVPTDLAQPEAAQKLFETCEAEKWEVELLINNAGFGLSGAFLDLTLAQQSEMMQLNMQSLVNLSHLFGKKMADRKSGGIINVASTAAFQAIPYLGVYAATKAFVLSFSEALHVELSPFNVKVMALCPGGTATNFFNAAGFDRNKLQITVETPEAVVATAMAAFDRGDSSVISGFANKLLNFSERLVPRELVTKITASLFKP
jgi:short-subunit dehydrogenase